MRLSLSRMKVSGYLALMIIIGALSPSTCSHSTEIRLLYFGSKLPYTELATYSAHSCSVSGSGVASGAGVGVDSGVYVTSDTDASTSAVLEDVSPEFPPVVSEISVMTIIAAKKYMK